MGDTKTLDPCFTAEEARKRTKEKTDDRTPRFMPSDEDLGHAKTVVREYFKKNIEHQLAWGLESRSLQIKVEGGASDMRSCALARELASFLRSLGYHAAYGPHESHYEDEFDDDEFWPVFINW